MKRQIGEKTRAEIKLILTIIKFGIFLIILVGIPAYIFFFQKDFLSNFESFEALNAFLLQYKTASIFTYISMQVLQIIICIIPGQALQFAAGYAYSFWLGYLFSIIGAAIGTVITFYLARLLGKGALRLIFGEKRFDKFIKKLNTKRAFILVFIIFLIPGLPKDLVNYAAGVSDIKLKPFFISSLVARTPAMMCSIMVGSMFNKGSYIGIAILSAIVLICCILGIKYHEKLAKKADTLYVRLMNM